MIFCVYTWLHILFISTYIWCSRHKTKHVVFLGNLIHFFGVKFLITFYLITPPLPFLSFPLSPHAHMHYYYFDPFESNCREDAPTNFGMHHWGRQTFSCVTTVPWTKSGKSMFILNDTMHSLYSDFTSFSPSVPCTHLLTHPHHQSRI